MKKIILLAAIAVFGFTNVNAQGDGDGDGDGGLDTFQGLSLGDVYGMTSLRFGSSKTGDNKDNGFTIMPKAALMVTDKISVGLQAGYMSSKSESGSTTTSEQNTVMLGAFARHYCHPEKRFSLFGELGVNYESINYKSIDLKENGFNVELGGGLRYALSNRWALDTSFSAIRYETLKPDTDGAESTNNFDIGLDLKNVNFGLTYNFQ